MQEALQALQQHEALGVSLQVAQQLQQEKEQLLQQKQLLLQQRLAALDDPADRTSPRDPHQAGSL